MLQILIATIHWNHVQFKGLLVATPSQDTGLYSTRVDGALIFVPLLLGRADELIGRGFTNPPRSKEDVPWKCRTRNSDKKWDKNFLRDFLGILRIEWNGGWSCLELGDTSLLVGYFRTENGLLLKGWVPCHVNWYVDNWKFSARRKLAISSIVASLFIFLIFLCPPRYLCLWGRENEREVDIVHG